MASTLTRPMFRRYYDVWREHADRYGPKTALLYQVGGFFEIYDTENLTTGATQANIREIAEICQLSLTVKEVAGDGATQTLFGGFPDYSLTKFERILVGAGYTVVVVVQRKGRTGAVEERVVDHISSPGCFVEGGSGGRGDRHLVGVVLESVVDGPAALRRCYWAVGALELATGRIWFAEGQAPDRLHQFLCMHPPSELVIWSDGGAAAGDLTALLREATGAAACHVKCLAASSVAVEEATLERWWAPVRLRLEWVGRLPQARRAVAALMEFAAEHTPSALRSIAVPEAWLPVNEVRLGNAALEQLGMLTLRGGDDRQSLLSMMDQCRSVAGRRLMRERLLRPICDRSELERRLDRVDAAGAALGDPVLTALTERCLRTLYDMSRLWRRAELGTAGMGDLACLLRSWDAARSLMDAWPGAVVPVGVRELVDWALGRWSTTVLGTMSREGVSTPVAELPWAVGIGLAPALEAQFAVGRALRTEAEALCGHWSSLGRGETLYLDDAEGGGFRITGTKRRIAAVLTVLRDEGDTTAVQVPYKATASLETAGLTALGERHRAWMAGWSVAWAEAWAAGIAELVARGREAARALESWCAELDLAWTTARLSRDWLWRRPVFVEAEETDASIAVSGLRHPILERLVTVPYVSHSVELNSTNSGILLYGMNASGKSSLMKAIGLCVLLAQSGFPVPATECRLVPFTALMTRILGNDNLWAGQSSFVVEMTELREILRYADARALVLGDELCKGTESLSATALVASAVEDLTRRRAKFVFATHLHELATLPDIAGLTAVRALHLRVEYDAASDRLIYGRDLLPGAGSALYGLEVCRALDLPAGWLDRATVIRQQLAGWQPARTSAYSAGAVVGACQVCGASGTAARLESHHIRPQAERAAAAAAGVDLDAAGNLVCLCAGCHDDHHGGRLVVEGWEDTSAGRRLRWSRSVVGAGAVVALTPATDEVQAWIREQRMRKVTIARIQAVGRQLFGVELTRKEIQAVR